MQEKKPYILGLTGSLGAGKTETARMFQRLGLWVFEADQVVSDFYETWAPLSPALHQLFPDISSSVPIRLSIARSVVGHPEKLHQLEELIHPFVLQVLEEHLEQAKQARQKITVLDVPLLFELGWDRFCHGVLVVTCDPNIQIKRVMERPYMTAEKFSFLQKRHWSDQAKKERAHFHLDTSHSRLETFRALCALLKTHSSLCDSL